MRRITLSLLFLLVGWHIHAQTLTIGTGTASAQEIENNPVSGYYQHQRYQVVYTVAELAASMTPYDEITALGFSVSQDYGGGSLLGYTIRIAHTTAANAASHFAGPFTVVKEPFDYDPTVKAAGEFDMIDLDLPFVWNGIENIVIDICTDGANPYVSPYGGVRIVALADGARIIRSDDVPTCGVSTASAIANRPNIRFTYTEGTPPSCLAPVTLSTGSITAHSAVLHWIETGNAAAWNVEYGPEGFEQGTGTIASNVANAHPIAMLDPQANYEFYVQSVCGSSTSSWSGPSSFSTLCDPFGSFAEGFESTPMYAMPECWTRKAVSSSTYSNVYVVDSGPNSGNMSLGLVNQNVAPAVLYAVTPALEALPLGTHQIRFFLGGVGSALQVGTMTDPNDPATFTMVQEFTPTANYVMHVVNFNAPTTDTHVAFRATYSGTYQYATIDDLAWQAIPSTAPLCVPEVAVSVDPSCGNYATTLGWEHSEGADGYRLLVGTTPGGTDVLDTVTGNIGYTDSYPFMGNFDTTYYYTLIPYNLIGNAQGCTEGTFTTAENGCYCISQPETVDGQGITGIQLAGVDYEIDNDTYVDNSDEVAILGQGLYSALLVSTNTWDFGYAPPYDVNVWIDFNDNYNFEPAELLFSGTTDAEADTMLDASFAMPANAPVGQHRLRIGASYSGVQETPDPCYTGEYTYGATVDFTVEIVVPTCSPPVATALVEADCANGQYFVAVDVTTLGTGSPIEVIEGNLSVLATITAAGVHQIGPFGSGSSISLKLHHATDALCDLPLGTFTYACPPANDTCATAIDLGNETSPLDGTTLAAGNDNLFACNNTGGTDENLIPDVYYSIVVPPGSSLQIGLSNADFDSSVIVFRGDCDNRTPITCFDDPDDQVVVWGNDTGAPATVYWVQDAYSGQGEFTLEWSIVECISPVVAFSIITLCDGEEGTGFQVLANITSLGTATSLTVSDSEGNSTGVTATGPILMGPYENNTDVVVTAASDGQCNTVSEILNQVACPPSNDGCMDAIILVPGNNFAANAVESTVLGATDSNQPGNTIPVPECANYEGGDVWYKVVVPVNGSITIETGPSVAAANFDSGLAAYSGSCDALVLIECDDDDADTGNFSRISLTGRTAGEIIHIRVWEYSNDEPLPFAISAWNSTLGTESLETGSFIAYPNPVRDMLSLSHDSGISTVEVFNVLGQQVGRTTINSNSGMVDMSGLSSGTYLLKVGMGDTFTTLKVIKQ